MNIQENIVQQRTVDVKDKLFLQLNNSNIQMGNRISRREMTLGTEKSVDKGERCKNS